MRTIWRRPPHRQAGIVSVRVGTASQVTVPHDWQTCSATAGMPSHVPGRSGVHLPTLQERRRGRGSILPLGRR
jgi:hypothetical protein